MYDLEILEEEVILEWGEKVRTVTSWEIACLSYARYQRYQLLFCFYRWHSRRQIPFIINRWRWW
jgi:hypothetical protein